MLGFTSWAWFLTKICPIGITSKISRNLILRFWTLFPRSTSLVIDSTLLRSPFTATSRQPEGALCEWIGLFQSERANAMIPISYTVVTPCGSRDSVQRKSSPTAIQRDMKKHPELNYKFSPSLSEHSCVTFYNAFQYRYTMAVPIDTN